jgi:FkbM family methyltransferase
MIVSGADAGVQRIPLWLDLAARVVRALPAGRYRAMNWVARRNTGPFVARMPRDLGGLRFLCDLSDPLMREVCLTGRYEPQETALLQRLLADGMTAVDVGANWGYFTLVAAHLVGPRGHVVSVEADPRAHHTLAWNVSSNGLRSVRVVAAAAADQAGMLSFAAYGTQLDTGSNFGLVLASASDDGGRRFDVPAKPLDRILDEAGIGRVDVLKMDIEGAEARAIAGLARRLSTGQVDRIVLELHPAYLREQGSSARAVIDCLSGYGYRAWSIDHSPRTHHRAVSRAFDAASLLTPFASDGHLGEWPHLLWAREGLDALPG